MVFKCCLRLTQTKHYSSTLLTLVKEIHQRRWIPLTNGHECDKRSHVMTSQNVGGQRGISAQFNAFSSIKSVHNNPTVLIRNKRCSGSLMFSVLLAGTSCWTNCQATGDFRRLIWHHCDTRTRWRRVKTLGQHQVGVNLQSHAQHKLWISTWHIFHEFRKIMPGLSYPVSLVNQNPYWVILLMSSSDSNYVANDHKDVDKYGSFAIPSWVMPC